jgi:hypothetical protein
VYQRLWAILTGHGSEKEPQVAPEDRQAILEILRETKPNLPDYWKDSSAKKPS